MSASAVNNVAVAAANGALVTNATSVTYFDESNQVGPQFEPPFIGPSLYLY